jgi:transposase InsO family protein
MEIVAFIDEHRGRSGYWVARKRPPSARAVRDAELVVEIRRVCAENLFVYGADKIWTQLNRENIAVGRGRVERLMRQEGLSGARRGKAFRSPPPPTTGCIDRLISWPASSGRWHLTGCGWLI